MKTAKYTIEDHKDPDGWGEFIHALGLTDRQANRYFDFHEYASVEIEVDENLNVVGGRIVPRRK